MDTIYPESIEFHVDNTVFSDTAFIATMLLNNDTEPSFANTNYQFVQTKFATEKGIAIHKYGAIIIPESAIDNVSGFVPTIKIVNKTYVANAISSYEDLSIGTNFTFTPANDSGDNG